MSERSGRSRIEVTILLGLALIVFAGLVQGLASWLTAVSAPEAEGANAVNTDPLPTWQNILTVNETKARQLAFKEVKQREGWLGTVTQAELDEMGWSVTVGHEPDVSHDYRIVEVDAQSGKVLDYRTTKPQAPQTPAATPKPGCKSGP